MQNELKYAKIFESTGLKRADTEKYLQVIEGAILDIAITKMDFQRLELRVESLDRKIDGLDHRIGGLDHRIDSLEFKIESFKSEIKLEINQILKKLGLTIVITAGLMTTLLSAFGAFLKFVA